MPGCYLLSLGLDYLSSLTGFTLYLWHFETWKYWGFFLVIEHEKSMVIRVLLQAWLINQKADLCSADTIGFMCYPVFGIKWTNLAGIFFFSFSMCSVHLTLKPGGKLASTTVSREELASLRRNATWQMRVLWWWCQQQVPPSQRSAAGFVDMPCFI